MNTLRLAAVAACLLLATPAHAYIDHGGKVWSYALRTKSPAHINYTCMSACTLRLANPRTCVGPRAVFVFHAPFNAGRHNARIGRWMMGLYPPPIRSWIRSRGGLTSRPIVLRGAALRARVRAC